MPSRAVAAAAVIRCPRRARRTLPRSPERSWWQDTISTPAAAKRARASPRTAASGSPSTNGVAGRARFEPSGPSARSRRPRAAPCRVCRCGARARTGPAALRRDQLRDRARERHAPVAAGRHLVREARDLLEALRRPHDGSPAGRGEPATRRLTRRRPPGRGRASPRRRAGSAARQERPRDREPLLHAVRVVADLPSPPRRARPGQGASWPGRGRRRRSPWSRAKKTRFSRPEIRR